VTEQQILQLKAVKQRSRFWWWKFWNWPKLISSCHDEMQQLHGDLTMMRDTFRREQSRSESLEHLVEEIRGNDRRRQEALESEKKSHQEALRDVELLREFIHRTHRISLPTRRGIKAVLAGGRRLTIFLALLLPLCLCAQFPPPFFRNAWSTNVPPAPVLGNNNLSVTNVGSGTNWLFYQVGPFTIARLTDVSNIVSGVPSGGSNYVFNPNQFMVIAGGTNVSLKAGAFMTNFNGFLPGTNHNNFRVEGDFNVQGGDIFSENIFPSLDDNYSLGSGSAAWNQVAVRGAGLQLMETGGGADFVRHTAPSSIGSTYSVVWPNVQGANGSSPTNDGLGNLGWWPVTSVVAAKQFGDAVLSNLVGTVASNLTNLVSLSTTNATSKPLTNRFNNGVLTLFGLEAGANIVLSQNESNIVITGSVLMGDSGGTNARQFGTLTLTNLSGNPNIATNILGAGFVTVSSNNAGTWTILGVASGETNFNGEVSVTNSTRIGLVNGKSNNTNLLRSVQGGNGIVLTNEGTNVMLAIDPAVVASQANLTSVSNLAQTKLTSVMTNSVIVSGPTATNINIVTGTNGIFLATNTTGSVGIELNTRWGLSNVYYVSHGANISNVFAAITSGSSVEFDSMTNQTRGRVPALFQDLPFVDLKLSNLVNVTLRGSGNTVIYGTNDGMLFGFQQCTNLLIQGITFRGTQTNNDYQIANMSAHGMVTAFGTNQNVTFRDCVFEDCNYFALMSGYDNTGLGIKHKTLLCKLDNCRFTKCGYTNHVGGANNPDGGAANLHQDTTIDKCIFDRCGRGIESFSATETTHLTVRDSSFIGIWKRGIHIANGSTFTSHFLIDGCKFIPDNAARGGGNHMFFVSVDSGTIQNCLITNTTLAGDACIEIGNSSAAGIDQRNVSIVNNTFADVREGVWLTHGFGGLVSGNRFVNVTGNALILASDSVVATGNTFLNCSPSTSVINGCCGNGTNMVIAENRFVRTSGTAPTTWIALDSSQRRTVLRDNLHSDVSGAVPLLLDSGIDTIRITSDQLLTNSTFINFTNLNATGTLTNMGSVTVPGNSLTNNNRRVVGYWSGTFPAALANTNQFQIVFGSQTILDTGLQIASNCHWRCSVAISRANANTAQIADAWFQWGPGGGAPFDFTNRIISLAQTNGIATLLALRHGARRVGAATNNYFRVNVEQIEP
jgi:hypothetical protein